MENFMRYLAIAMAVFIACPVWAGNAHATKPDAGNASVSDAGYREISWDILVPKDWDPSRRFRNFKLGNLKDGDPRAQEVLDLMKEEWDNAPINPKLDGKKVKIAGFVVPIEETDHAMSEFLLVPYFGACIHVPPPPANQIIHVISATPIKGVRVMDAVWVEGKLKAALFSKETSMGLGASGYQINSVSVTPYKEPAIMTIMPGKSKPSQ